MSYAIPIREALGRLFLVLWSAAAVAGLYLGMTMIGPAAELRRLPVLSMFEAQIEKIEANVVTFRVAFDKERPCEFSSVRWFVGRYGDWYSDAKLSIEGYSGATLPVGTAQRPNRWVVTFPEGYEGDPHFVVFRHRCHGLYETETVFAFASWLHINTQPTPKDPWIVRGYP